MISKNKQNKIGILLTASGGLGIPSLIDCLRYKRHPSHFNLEDVLNFVKIVNPKKTILTNLNNEIDYNEIKKILPKNVVPAYDGMSFLF